MDFTYLLEKGLKNLSGAGAFLTAGDGRTQSAPAGAGVNTMTISWGFVGFIWAKPHFITVVRPQRYTRTLLDAGDSFTISVPFDGTLKEELAICGTQSGRDINKAEIVRFIPARSVASPIVAGCGLYYECLKKHAQPIDGELLPKEIKGNFYNEDFHIMYCGEIVECYSL
ncbi:MAG: flavin reductase family protein [Clostridiales bacterium]|jgi:flavin reductase (DIM6/NTAB) family NADH-FMN oxidoreductase RutF|nr:flavin reductase family protein [Clostridiales bacterium]